MSNTKKVTGWLAAALVISTFVVQAGLPALAADTDEEQKTSEHDEVGLSVGRSHLLKAPWPVAKVSVAEYYQENGVFPADNAEAGLDAAGTIQGKYVSSVTVADDVITILYGNQANPQINGDTVTLTAADLDGSVTWTCASGGAIQDKHLPAACR